MRLATCLAAIALAITLAACTKPAPERVDARDDTRDKAVSAVGPVVPRKIILMIGDGMGNPITTAAAYAKGEPLTMQRMPHIGFIRTHEFEFVTTDSAASATAFATGKKAHYEAVSVTPGTTKAQESDPAHHLQHTVSVARAAGWKTGLVATSRIVHATPAAFAAHREHRQSYEEIALDMAGAGVDVMLGAGSNYFSKRKDGQDLMAPLTAQGYRVARTAEEVRAQSASPGKLIGLLHDKDMPSMQQGGRAMSLAELTQAALGALDDGPDSRFFLMIEGSQIDWEEHDMDGEGAVAETLDFDRAVAAARAYVAAHPDTLLIVTADHETGGLGLIDDTVVKRYAKPLGGLEASNAATQFARGREPGPQVTQVLPMSKGPLNPPELAEQSLAITFGYLSAASRPLWKAADEFLAVHTATMVPLYAEGAQAHAAARLRDNAELGEFIIKSIQQKQPVAEAGAALDKTLIGASQAVNQPERRPQDVSEANISGVDSAQAMIQPERRPQAVSGANSQGVDRAQAVIKPKNVILFVGDGMGLAAVTASYYARGESAMLSMPVAGLVSTHGLDRLVNDSAATATALSTGRRTRYGAVGTAPGPDGSLVGVETVLEAAEARGLKTGLVTSTQLTHATPAAFYAHEGSRGTTAAIAAAFVDLPTRVKGADGVDVAFAGGATDVTAPMREALVAQGEQAGGVTRSA